MVMGKKLVWYRTNAGHTQESLSVESGVSRQMISLIERDKGGKISIETLEKLLTCCGVTLEEFFREPKNQGKSSEKPMFNRLDMNLTVLQSPDGSLKLKLNDAVFDGLKADGAQPDVPKIKEPLADYIAVQEPANESLVQYYEDIAAGHPSAMEPQINRIHTDFGRVADLENLNPELAEIRFSAENAAEKVPPEIAKVRAKLYRLYKVNRPAFDNVAGTIDVWLKTAKPDEKEAEAGKGAEHVKNLLEIAKLDEKETKANIFSKLAATLMVAEYLKNLPKAAKLDEKEATVNKLPKKESMFLFSSNFLEDLRKAAKPDDKEAEDNKLSEMELMSLFYFVLTALEERKSNKTNE